MRFSLCPRFRSPRIRTPNSVRTRSVPCRLREALRSFDAPPSAVGCPVSGRSPVAADTTSTLKKHPYAKTLCRKRGRRPRPVAWSISEMAKDLTIT